MLIIFLLFIPFVLVLFVIDTLRYGITPTSTSKKVRTTLFKNLPIDFQGRVADLGSGFGDFASSLSRHLGYSIDCYEMGRIPYWVSTIWLLFKRERVQVLRRDFLKEDLREYDLVFCYLYRKVMPRLWKKLQKELRPGSWVISHTFAFEGVKPKKVIHADDLYHTPIYFYQVSAQSDSMSRIFL